MANLAGIDSLLPKDIMGHSVVPLDGDEDADPTIYSEGTLLGSTKRALLRGRHKLIFDMRDGPEKLYDVVEDPLEQHDLRQQHPVVAASLRKQLDALHALLDADYQAEKERLDEKPKTADQKKRAIEALRALGYVGE
jgi:arylsulfatase A-like enzyme